MSLFNKLVDHGLNIFAMLTIGTLTYISSVVWTTDVRVAKLEIKSEAYADDIRDVKVYLQRLDEITRSPPKWFEDRVTRLEDEIRHMKGK